MLQKNVQVNRKILATPTIQYTLYSIHYTFSFSQPIYSILISAEPTENISVEKVPEQRTGNTLSVMQQTLSRFVKFSFQSGHCSQIWALARFCPPYKFLSS